MSTDSITKYSACEKYSYSTFDISVRLIPQITKINCHHMKKILLKKKAFWLGWKAVNQS